MEIKFVIMDHDIDVLTDCEILCLHLFSARTPALTGREPAGFTVRFEAWFGFISCL